jgi:hypothetical protein
LAEPEMLLFDPGSSPLGLRARNVLKVEDVGKGAQVTILSDCRTSRGLPFAALMRFLRAKGVPGSTETRAGDPRL